MGDLTWDFSERAALVTGASRGIGLAVAELIADDGGTVVVLSRTPPESEHDLVWAPGDVTDREAVDAAAGRLVELTGRVDVCVANAGVGLVEDFAATTDEEWAR